MRLLALALLAAPVATPAAVHPLDPAAIDEASSTLRGGFNAEKYTITYPGRTLTIVLRAEPGAGGRIEQFTVYPAE